MKHSDMKVHRLLAPLAALLVLACGESTAPDGARSGAVSTPPGSVVPVPDPTDALVGRIILCKATESLNPPATTFTFNVALATDPVSNPTVDVGACIDIVNDAPNAHSATILGAGTHRLEPRQHRRGSAEPFDDTWDLLASGSSTIFYLSAQT